MNTPTDPALRDLLRRADPAAGLPAVDAAAFAAGVHARIHDGNTAALGSAFARQLFPLAAALALLAAVGAGSAAAYARERESRVETLASAYARSIDPWQKHGAAEADAHAGHHHP